MIVKKTILATLAVSLSVGLLATGSSIALAQSKFPYKCETSFRNYAPIKDRVKRRTNNLPQTLLYQKLIQIWDGKYIRAGCEAFLRGESWDDSCLNGRRNWEEINASIPDGAFAGTPAESAKIYTPFAKDKTFTEAYQFCRANGFYTAFKG